MANRFVAFIQGGGRGRDLSENLENRTDFHRVLDADGLVVLAEDAADCILLPNSGGAIIGTLFRRAERRRVIDLSQPELDELDRTSGACLINRYWGGYPAILGYSRD